MDEVIRSLHKRYSAEIVRLHGVLMGVATAAIAFALHETAEQVWSFAVALKLLAAVVWGVSVAAGVKFSENFSAATKANIGMLEAKKIGYEQGEAMSKEWLEKANRRSGFGYRMQQRFLLVGVLIYLGGHIFGIPTAT